MVDYREVSEEEISEDLGLLDRLREGEPSREALGQVEKIKQKYLDLMLFEIAATARDVERDIQIKIRYQQEEAERTNPHN